MVKKENFSKAYTEVYEILKHLPQEEYAKIDDNFIKMIKSKRDINYIFEIDYSKSIEEQEVLKETKIVLAYLFLNYLGTEEENRIIKQKFKEDIIHLEEKKRDTIKKQ